MSQLSAHLSSRTCLELHSLRIRLDEFVDSTLPADPVQASQIVRDSVAVPPCISCGVSSEALQEFLDNGGRDASWRRSSSRGKRIHATVHVCPQAFQEVPASTLGKGEIAAIHSSSFGQDRSRLTWSLGQDNSDLRSGLLSLGAAARGKACCGICGGDRVELRMAEGAVVNGEIEINGALKFLLPPCSSVRHSTDGQRPQHGEELPSASALTSPHVKLLLWLDGEGGGRKGGDVDRLLGCAVMALPCACKASSMSASSAAGSSSSSSSNLSFSLLFHSPLCPNLLSPSHPSSSNGDLLPAPLVLASVNVQSGHQQQQQRQQQQQPDLQRHLSASVSSSGSSSASWLCACEVVSSDCDSNQSPCHCCSAAMVLCSAAAAAAVASNTDITAAPLSSHSNLAYPLSHSHPHPHSYSKLPFSSAQLTGSHCGTEALLSGLPPVSHRPSSTSACLDTRGLVASSSLSTAQRGISDLSSLALLLAQRHGSDPPPSLLQQLQEHGVVLPPVSAGPTAASGAGSAVFQSTPPALHILGSCSRRQLQQAKSRSTPLLPDGSVAVGLSSEQNSGEVLLLGGAGLGAGTGTGLGVGGKTRAKSGPMGEEKKPQRFLTLEGEAGGWVEDGDVFWTGNEGSVGEEELLRRGEGGGTSKAQGDGRWNSKASSRMGGGGCGSVMTGLRGTVANKLLGESSMGQGARRRGEEGEGGAYHEPTQTEGPAFSVNPLALWETPDADAGQLWKEGEEGIEGGRGVWRGVHNSLAAMSLQSAGKDGDGGSEGSAEEVSSTQRCCGSVEEGVGSGGRNEVGGMGRWDIGENGGRESRVNAGGRGGGRGGSDKGWAGPLTAEGWAEVNKGRGGEVSGSGSGSGRHTVEECVCDSRGSQRVFRMVIPEGFDTEGWGSVDDMDVCGVEEGKEGKEGGKRQGEAISGQVPTRSNSFGSDTGVEERGGEGSVSVSVGGAGMRIGRFSFAQEEDEESEGMFGRVGSERRHAPSSSALQHKHQPRSNCSGLLTGAPAGVYPCPPPVTERAPDSGRSSGVTGAGVVGAGTVGLCTCCHGSEGEAMKCSHGGAMAHSQPLLASARTSGGEDSAAAALQLQMLQGHFSSPLPKGHMGVASSTHQTAGGQEGQQQQHQVGRSMVCGGSIPPVVMASHSQGGADMMDWAVSEGP